MLKNLKKKLNNYKIIKVRKNIEERILYAGKISKQIKSLKPRKFTRIKNIKFF